MDHQDGRALDRVYTSSETTSILGSIAAGGGSSVETELYIVCLLFFKCEHNGLWKQAAMTGL
jgi:hypothetical protein